MNEMQSWEVQQPAPEPTPPKKNKKAAWIALGVAVILIYFASMTGLAWYLLRQAPSAPETGEPTQTQTEENSTNAPIKTNPSEDGNNLIVNDDYSGKALTAAQLYENNVDTVVFVEAKFKNGSGSGSGFVIDSENGYLLTNCHVVQDCLEVAVTFSNGDSYPAEVIGADAINDVAVLKIKATGLKHVTIGNSDNLRIGDDVLVIGNPLGDLTFTLTKGIVSGTNRTINTGEYAIQTFQTDAAINSGNSGGPAFDATGAVIGIASAKYAATGVEGICFCIPINDAMRVANDLVNYGYVKGRSNLGVTVSTSPGYRYEIDALGRRVLVETAYGAQIEEIGKSSCAKKAGLEVGDIITKFQNTKITTANELINAKNKYKAGETVTVEYYRDGQTHSVKITLDEYTP